MLRKLLFILSIISCAYSQIDLTANYLVITPDVFIGPATSWDTQLVSLQNDRGFETIVEEVSLNTSTTTIQTLISDYYTQGVELQYVLLIGNGVNLGNGDITNPDYLFKAHGTIPSQVDPVADVYIPFFEVETNSIWHPEGLIVASDGPYTENLSGNGEVTLGRIPVESIQEIEDFVDKLDAYYSSNDQYDGSKDKELYLGLDVKSPWNLCTATLVNTIRDDMINTSVPTHLAVTQLNVSSMPTNPFGHYAGRDSQFVAQINSGVGLISTVGTHGGPFNLCGWFSTLDDNGTPLSDYSQITNSSYPFLLGANCHQGEVNNPDVDGVMRKLLVQSNSGIIGSIAPSSGTEQHANGYVLNRFHELIFEEGLQRAGEIHKVLKDELATVYPLMEFYSESLNLYGDPSMQLPVYQHLSSNLSADLTLDGYYVIDQTITIPDSVTINIEPGTALFFSQGSYLTVEGSLVAEGTETNPIVFGAASATPSTSYWNGILVQNGGSTDLDNFIIRNASKGVWVNGATCSAELWRGIIEDCVYGFFVQYNDDSLIKFSSILNTKYGIYAYYSDLIITDNIVDGNENGNGFGYRGIYAYQSHFQAHRNDFLGHSNYGMYINKSNPLLTRNDISGGQYGIYAVNYAGPDLSTGRVGDHTVNNYIHGMSSYGVYISNNSNPDLGTYSQVYIGGPTFLYYGGFNYFNNISSFDIINYSPNNIKAELNWWQGNAPYVSNQGGGSIDTSPRAEQMLGVGPVLSKSNSGTPDELELMYIRAKILETDSLYSEAIAVYDSVIVFSPQDPISQKALISIERSSAFSDNGIGYLDRLNDYINAYPDLYIGFISRYFAAGELARQGDFQGALLGYQECLAIFESLPEAYEESAWMLFSIGQIYEAMSGLESTLGKGSSSSNLAKVSENYNRVLDEYASSDAASTLRELLGIINDPEGAISLPRSYKIGTPYPNPFNPTTTIEYELPEFTNVNITIFDILGREIWNREILSQEPGIYSQKWNGMNHEGRSVSSGIYLISFQTKNFHATQKVLLIR